MRKILEPFLALDLAYAVVSREFASSSVVGCVVVLPVAQAAVDPAVIAICVLVANGTK